METSELVEMAAEVARTLETKIIPYSKDDLRKLQGVYRKWNLSIRRCNEHGQHLTAGGFLKIAHNNKERRLLPVEYKQAAKNAGDGETFVVPESLAGLFSRYVRTFRYAYLVHSDFQECACFLITDTKK